MQNTDLPEDLDDPHVDPNYVGSDEEMEDDVDDRDTPRPIPMSMTMTVMMMMMITMVMIMMTQLLVAASDIHDHIDCIMLLSYVSF